MCIQRQTSWLLLLLIFLDWETSVYSGQQNQPARVLFSIFKKLWNTWMGIIDLAGGKIQNNVSSSKLRLYAKIESFLSDCRKWPKSQRKCVICYTPQFELLHVSLCPNRDMFIYLTVSDYGDIKTPFGSLTHGFQYPSKVSPSRLDPHFFQSSVFQKLLGLNHILRCSSQVSRGLKQRKRGSLNNF